MRIQYEQHLILPEGARLLVGKLTKKTIDEVFSITREYLGAKTKYKAVRRVETVTTGQVVRWSLWIGRFESVPPWFDSSELKDVRHSFVLLLEKAHVVAAVSTLAGDIVSRLGLDNLDYEVLVKLHSDPSTEYGGLSIRSLQPSTAGVARSSLSGQRLEQAVSRIMAHRAIPTRVSFETSGTEWRISTMTGRVGKAGSKVHVADLCQWFSELVDDLENPSISVAPFIESFAQPQSISQIGRALEPRGFQLDPGVIQERLDAGWSLEAGGVPLGASDLSELIDRFKTLWTLLPQSDPSDPTSPPSEWKIVDSARELGTLVWHTTKLGLKSSYLNNIQAIDPVGKSSSLKTWFNGGGVPFLVSFDDPSYAYYFGQLFRDHRLIGNTVYLIDVLKGDLPQGTVGEKTHAASSFDPLSLFGFTEQYAGNDDFLICEDLDKEWADYISISRSSRTLSFYHCKGGSPAVGASGLHEVVAQALKNLGFLTAELPDLQRRRDRWMGMWGNTLIPRLRKGSSVDEFITGFHDATSSPNFSAKVNLVVAGLSKSRVENAFGQLRAGSDPGFNVTQLLWLLSFFVDGCRLANAVPVVICEP